MKKFTQTINNEAETSKWILKNATTFTSYEQHKRQQQQQQQQQQHLFKHDKKIQQKLMWSCTDNKTKLN